MRWHHVPTKIRQSLWHIFIWDLRYEKIWHTLNYLTSTIPYVTSHTVNAINVHGMPGWHMPYLRRFGAYLRQTAVLTNWPRWGNIAIEAHIHLYIVSIWLKCIEMLDITNDITLILKLYSIHILKLYIYINIYIYIQTMNYNDTYVYII